ncbi:MAG: hypothetical protein ACE5IR_24225 [bacterium]
MPALAASDVTVTIEKENRSSELRMKRNRVKIAFGDGSLTYPTGGVPMPAIGNFGMVNNLDFLNVVDDDDSQGIVWKYDKDNNKLRAYIMGVDVTAAGSGTLDDFPLDTTGEPLAEAASLGAVGLEAGVNLLGRLQELKTTSAPAVQTIYAEAVGW